MWGHVLWPVLKAALPHTEPLGWLRNGAGSGDVQPDRPSSQTEVARTPLLPKVMQGNCHYPGNYLRARLMSRAGGVLQHWWVPAVMETFGASGLVLLLPVECSSHDHCAVVQ